MLFTVVIPIYNSASYIAKTLESIDNASTALEYEILLIDDFSNDINDLREIIKNFEKVKLIVKDKKSNAADSRNIGFLKSNSRYVFFLDSDDHFIGNAIDNRINNHKSYEAGVIFGNFITDNGTEKLKSELPDYQNEDLRDYILVKKGDVRSSVISVDKNYHKGTLFDSESQKHQDWIFAFRCWDNKEKIIFDDQYITTINIDRNTRMSASLNPKASRYFYENYLTDINHINKFCENNWKQMIYSKDYTASRFFLSIYRPRNNSEHLNYLFYKVLANKYLLPFSSVAAKKVRDKLAT